ncbi:High-affinity potassium transport protein [Nakaseomyces bracarensis]|uniref:High-affinity potassium transport protein n=1 Tax=Nakaseomyces bracarensis TaxID=273131 RepID=A0ABR4NR72_9SACH
MELRRRLSRVHTLTPFQFSYKKTFGHKFRDVIAKSGHYLSPIQKYVFPNFIAVHYFYIISMTILASILMYPVRNFKYIDILFLASGATTQGGLNTIDVNALTLYQQIIIYIICNLCTPIAIHGALAFVRLYWFERHFDNIRDSSKRNFKMRRTKTILERQKTARTLSRLRTNTTQNRNRVQTGNNAAENFQEKLFSGELINRDEQNSVNSRDESSENGSQIDSASSNQVISADAGRIRKSMSPKSGTSSIPTSTNTAHEIPGKQVERPILFSDRTSDHSAPNKRERFKRRRSKDISPQDMYRSIMMLQDKHKQHEHLEEEEGPALVIGSPIDRDGNAIRDVKKVRSPVMTPIHSRSQSTQDISPNNSNSQSTEDISPNNSNSYSDDVNHISEPEDVSEYSASGSGNSNAIETSNDELSTTENDYGAIGIGDGKPHSNESLHLHSIGKREHLSNKLVSNDNENATGQEAVESGSDEDGLNSDRENEQDYSDEGYDTSSYDVGSNTRDEISSIDSANSALSSNSDIDDQNSFNRMEHYVNDDSNQTGDIEESKHITFGTANENDSPAKTGQPKIQFNITEPPRKKLLHQNQQNPSQISTIYATKKRHSSNSFLKQFTKGKKIRHNLKRRLSGGAIDRLENWERAKNKLKSSSNDATETNDNGEDYFADNESDDDKNALDRTVSGNLERSTTYDFISPKDLDKLAQEPRFQKMVYKNWKQSHRKDKKRRKSLWNKKFDFEGVNPNFFHNLENGAQHSNGYEDNNNNQYSYNNDPDKSSTIDDMDLQFDVGMNDDNYFGMNMDYVPPNNTFSRTMSANYLSWQPTIARNSLFVDLSKTQKEELGGVEYRATKLLCKILVFYYVGFHVMTFVMLVPWITTKTHYKNLVKSDGVTPAWWGFFTAMSAFNDLGLTLTPDSMSSFSTAIYPQIVMIWFIIIGNTGFPVLLRFIIWVLYKFAPDLSQQQESLGFLLDHPRRCFTLLFPSAATWWLLFILLALNITDWILFIILDFRNITVRGLSKGHRVLIGLFQAVTTRTAGFSIVNVSLLNAAIQVSYMIMMYVSVLPVAISIRRTNVYEEQSLGLYGKEMEEESSSESESEEESSDTELLGANRDSDDEEGSMDSQYYAPSNHAKVDSEESSSNEGSSNSTSKGKNRANDHNKNKKKKKKKKKKRGNKSEKEGKKSFIVAHLMRQLTFDIWYVFLGVFIICICENTHIQDLTKPGFNIFAVIFECVSAYGTVGLSLGYPDTNQSLSAQFNTMAKLIIIALLIRGRNRGLPYTLDRAIILPSDRLERIDHIEDLALKRAGGVQNLQKNKKKKSINRRAIKWLKKGGKSLLYPNKVL